MSKAMVEATANANQESKAVVKLLSNALQVAKIERSNADVAAQGAEAILYEKQQLLESSKDKEEDLVGRLEIAERDLEKTKESCAKASASAHHAKEAAKERRNIRKSLKV